MSVNSDSPIQQDVETVSIPESASEVRDNGSPCKKPSNHHAGARRARMIIGGLMATVILAVIAILVSGIFQLTSRWLMVCPKDLAVNDPAPILWQDVVTERAKSAKLGVPEELVTQAAFKSGSESTVSDDSAK